MAHSLYPCQVRAARAALSWSRRKLAEQAGITVYAVERFEHDKGRIGSHVPMLLYAALALDGNITFLDATKTEGPGIRLEDGSAIRLTKSHERSGTAASLLAGF